MKYKKYPGKRKRAKWGIYKRKTWHFNYNKNYKKRARDIKVGCIIHENIANKKERNTYNQSKDMVNRTWNTFIHIISAVAKAICGNKRLINHQKQTGMVKHRNTDQQITENELKSNNK